MATSTLADVAVSVALEEARRGVFERANDNRGDRVDEYEKLAGMQGEAWCAMFVYWCYEQAAGRLGVKNPMPRIFGAAQLEVWGVREKRMVTAPVAGDILIKERKHAGLVSGPATSSRKVPSIEGNTWAKTDFEHPREGVYVLDNEKVSKCTFIRVV